MSKLANDASTETVAWPPAASSVKWANSSGSNDKPAVERVSLPNRGHALLATRSVAAGEALWAELPVAWHRAPGTGRSFDGQRAACDHCGRWFDASEAGGGREGVAVCPGGCGVPFCSASCLTAANNAGHALLCAARRLPGITGSEAGNAKATGTLLAVEQELAADDNALFASHVGCAAKLLARAATRFLRNLQQLHSSLPLDTSKGGNSTTCRVKSMLEPSLEAALAAEATACLDVELAPWARPPWTVCTHAFRSGSLPPSPWGARASAPARAAAAPEAVDAKGDEDDEDEGPYSDEEPQFPDRDLMFQETLQPAYFAGALQQPRDVLTTALGASIAHAWDRRYNHPDHQPSPSSLSQQQQRLAGARVAAAWAAACVNDACFDGLMGCLRTNNQAVLIADPRAPLPRSNTTSEPPPSSIALQGTALYAVFATMNHACEPSIRNDPLRVPSQRSMSSLASEALPGNLGGSNRIEKEGEVEVTAELTNGDCGGCEVVGVNVLAAKPHRAGDEVRMRCRSYFDSFTLELFAPMRGAHSRNLVHCVISYGYALFVSSGAPSPCACQVLNCYLGTENLALRQSRRARQVKLRQYLFDCGCALCASQPFSDSDSSGDY